jgi:hypothetical protein
LGESVLGKSYNVIPVKVGIHVVEFASWIALERFTLCLIFAGMTDRLD